NLKDSGMLGTTDRKQQPHVKLAAVTDGLSNTICFAEIAGRQQIYYNGRPNGGATLLDGGLTLNSAWAAYNTARRITGYDTTGAPPLPANYNVGNGLGEPGPGCAAVNVSNVNGLYAFHTGGVNILRGDGSVSFLKQNGTPAVITALITRDGGESVQDNN